MDTPCGPPRERGVLVEDEEEVFDDMSAQTMLVIGEGETRDPVGTAIASRFDVTFVMLHPQ